MKIRYFTYITLLLSVIQVSFGCKGCISIDEHNIGKIVPKYKAVLVKFDIAYPYGDKHDAFTKFAEEVTTVDDFIVAEVGVKDYGEKENTDLAKKYGIQTKDDLPKVKLFTESLDDPITFLNEYTVENFRDFVRDNTNLYLGLPGCIERFDGLAKEFVATKHRLDVFEKAKLWDEEAKDEEKSSVQTYLLFMKKILDTGIVFVKQENTRLKKIIKEGKVNEKKKLELSQRLNILHSFKVERDEL